MNSDITIDDIDNSVKNNLYTQDYSEKPTIEGVQIETLTNYIGEDGDFSEILRINHNGELEKFPGFKIAQVNRSMIYPNMIKAWHIHLHQDEIWSISPESHLIVGLLDIRKNSPTNGIHMKIAIGGGVSKLILIPRGVAHGYSNVSGKQASLIYFVTQHYNKDEPDEKRLPWNTIGADFWLPTRD